MTKRGQKVHSLGQEIRKEGLIACQTLDGDEDFDEESDEDLPDFGIGGTKRSMKSPVEISLTDTDVDDNMNTENDNGTVVETSEKDTEDDSGKVVETSEKDTSEAESEKTSESSARETILKDLDIWKTKNKKKAKTVRPKGTRKRNKKVEKETQDCVSKERVISSEPTVVKVIADDDRDDFEEPMDAARRSAATTPNEEVLDQAEKETETTSVTSNSDVEFDIVRNLFETDPELTIVFPIFTPESALNQYAPQKRFSSVTRPARVKTPSII